MFDGYNEDALRVLFFARSALSEYGGSAVAPEHLVIGALDACPRTMLRFASSAEALQQIRERMVAGVSHAAQICEDVEVPFSSEARSVLQQAGIEADECSNPDIRPEHLIAGILVKTAGPAATALTDAGIGLSAIRDALLSS